MCAAVEERLPTSAREAATSRERWWRLASGRQPVLAPAALAAQWELGVIALQTAEIPGWLNKNHALNGTGDNCKQPPSVPPPTLIPVSHHLLSECKFAKSTRVFHQLYRVLPCLINPNPSKLHPVGTNILWNILNLGKKFTKCKT